MTKLHIEDLDKISKRVRESTQVRDGEWRAKVTVHMGTCGIAAGAREIMNTVREEFEKNNIYDVILTSSGCAGLCSKEPMMTVELKGRSPVKYVYLTPEKTRKILTDHIRGGKIVKEYALALGSERVY